jgi:hypothetical protein
LQLHNKTEKTRRSCRPIPSGLEGKSASGEGMDPKTHGVQEMSSLCNWSPSVSVCVSGCVDV